MYLVGQKKNLDLIKNWTTMPSFTIIQGNNDMGKTYFVKYLCKKYGLGYMLLDNKVDTVRKLVASSKPNGNIVYHFKDFHLASVNAKNALLKITEEPLEGNYIAITGLKQLDTLESRARIIKMQPYTDEELLEFIEKYSLDNDIAKKLLWCNFKTPSTLLKYGKIENIEDIISFASSIAMDIYRLSQTDVNRISTKFDRNYDKGKIDEALIFIEILCNLLEKQMLEKQYLGFAKELETLFKVKHLLSQGVNFNRRLLLQGAFESLMFKE